MSEHHSPKPTEVNTVAEELERDFKRFKQRFRELSDELANKEYPMTDNDLTLFRESLLDLPASERENQDLYTVRQAALDDPQVLRALFQVAHGLARLSTE